MTRLFRIRGGVHPDYRKRLSADRPIEDLPMPALLHIPVKQHVGEMAVPVVVRGQTVRKGDLIARNRGAVSARIHAPTSGRIMGIGDFPAHHPSGLSGRTITLQPDGEDRWTDRLEPCDDPFSLSASQIADRVETAGVVGMGGAAFPSAVKLNLGERYALHTLIINGAECEPYLTCDDRLMREAPSQIVDGIRIMAHALGVSKVLISIESNKPEALRAMQRACADRAGYEVVSLPSRYPMGAAKQLVNVLTGMETPARSLTAELGVVVHNVTTAHVVHQAVRLGWPLIARTVTVSGEAVRRPGNIRVLIGTPVQHLLDYCGSTDEAPARLVSGGPMMGEALPSARVPIVKSSIGLLALSAREVAARPEAPCIRCASCVHACPCGLLPLEMAARIRAGDLGGASGIGLKDCIACGSCSYVCPSNIPLVQFFNYAKGELTARDRSKNKQMQTRRLAEQRLVRLEEQKRRKRAAMEKRKRELAAKPRRPAVETEAVP